MSLCYFRIKDLPLLPFEALENLKEKNLKMPRKKQLITYKRKLIRLLADFSAQTLQEGAHYI